MSIFKEEEIIQGISEGKATVVTQFYKDNLPKVTGYILKNSGDETDAQDVFQDAMMLVFQKLGNNTLKLECSLSTYVYAVSRNLWMNVLRKRRKMLLNDTILDISKDLEASIIETIDKSEKKLLYQRHFAKLGTSCKNLLIHFFDGVSMSKISKLMGYSEGYTRKKKFECKEKLLSMIEKDPIYQELRYDNKNITADES
ncbi:RNA polymerase sigma factor [Spongiimicrobium sp. 3-5]|uniref:RNA polymerase sigma factor n=1 Tax=Spongiimicrobium sp. 3-5 TaxID=3332596 RepID=UPI00397EDF87